MASFSTVPVKFSLFAYFAGHCPLSELYIIPQAYLKQWTI